jgi:hypothetical protein
MMIKNVNGMLRKITYFRINVIVYIFCQFFFILLNGIKLKENSK